MAAGTALVVVFDSTPWCRFHPEALAVLSVAEKERSCRFRHAIHRETYVLAHALWRLVLGRMLDQNGAEVRMESTPEGQPRLPGTTCATSLSHSGSHVAIAVAHALCLGIDIERSPPASNLQDLVSMLCAPAELLALKQLSPPRRQTALLDLWTRKEALLKAFGVGLSETPASITADLDTLIAPPFAAPHVTACRIHPLSLGHGLSGALAAPENITTIALHWLEPPSAHRARDIARRMSPM